MLDGEGACLPQILIDGNDGAVGYYVVCGKLNTNSDF